MSDQNGLAWNLEIKLSAETFEALKSVARSTFIQIERAKNVNEMSFAGGDIGNVRTEYRVTANGPIRARIKALRDEADRLEREAGERGGGEDE